MLKPRAFSGLMALVLAIGMLFAGARPVAAASKSRENMWKIGTYALGAGTIYALTKKKGTLGLIGAAGTYMAYRQWKKEANNRRREEGRVRVRRSRR